MSIFLVSFATAEFRPSQERLIASARRFGVDKTLAFSPAHLHRTRFYHQHRPVLDLPRGAGYWLWKPYYIYTALKRSSPGDIIIYADAGLEFIDSLKPLIAIAQKKPLLLFADSSPFANLQWTKRDCFIKMDCDTPAYHHAPHLQAALQLYRRTPQSLRFVKEYLRYCSDPEIITDQKSRLGAELPGFIQHRHDQSVLSLLAKKHRLETFRDATQYGNHLKIPRFRVPGEFLLHPYSSSPQLNSPYPTLADHHRTKVIRHSLPYRFISKSRSLLSRLRTAADYASSRFWQAFGRKEFHLPFKSFICVYSPGTAILDQVKNGHYEKDLCHLISRTLSASSRPVFLDIGANIGLITLSIAASNPDCRIYCFEPGPHQAALLTRTIALNRLEKRVSLSVAALGDKNGSAAFAVHRPGHDSGDGFIDTQRAGISRPITVPLLTLDKWWIKHGRQPVTALKLDTEGSELLILRGGEKLISRCHPAIFLEISSKNLKVYPYRYTDIYRWFKNHGYSLYALKSQDLITLDNFAAYLPFEDSYYALPANA